MVQSVITADFTQRIQTLSQQVLSPTRLRPVIQTLGLVKADEEAKIVSEIQQNMTVEPVITSMSAAANEAGITGAKKRSLCQQRAGARLQRQLHRQRRNPRTKNLQCHDLADRG